MKTDYKLVEVNGVKIPFAYNINVSMELQDIYGTFDAWTKLFDTIEKDADGNYVEDKVNGVNIYQDGKIVMGTDKKPFKAKQREPRIKDVLITAREIINEGIRIYNEDNGKTFNYYEVKKIGSEIYPYVDLGKIIIELFTDFVNNKKKLEEEPKNVQTEQNQ